MDEQSDEELASADLGRELRTVPGALSTPLPVECVACYVWRMLDECGCNATLRWARRWRDARAPRATALEQRLARKGACCDCELFLNVWPPLADRSAACRGVRRGSSQPCSGWVGPR